ncbi:hypothetical protein [Actinomadura rupiterrae]|uniref:hypothetical protein n=1 Tax=Actinomadura rupiterrae TaxID=559627 RepID=UPI0020A460A6|nr:hypothetical protein [Actinomadura rupiterrae]MCP2337448.1 hypothetical protein [Actinomadura rupiterrae]
MRSFSLLAPAAAAVLAAAGVIAAPTARAAEPPQPDTATFHCAFAGPVPRVLPPWVNGHHCTPDTPGEFHHVLIIIKHPHEKWHCHEAHARHAHPGFVDVLGKICHPLHDD